jgi:hypothetical protein
MTRIGLLLFPALVAYASACRPATSPAPAAPEVAPLERSAEGGDGDLRSRGAFRAKESKQAAAELADAWLSVSIQTRDAEGRWWALAPGGRLRSGEVLVTEVELQRPAHVYVINVGASGQSTLLYPDANHEQDSLLGQGTHRLPPARSEYPYIVLDAEIGIEHVFVIATPKPIAGIDHALGELVARLRRGESPVLTQDGRAKSGSSTRAKGKPLGTAPSREQADEALFRANAGAVPELRTRGDVRARGEGATIDARAGDDGVVVVPFQFEHI